MDPESVNPANVDPGFMTWVGQKLQKLLSDLLSTHEWKSLDITYEPPHVERLWTTWANSFRISLHRIHPCTKALYHPHPWPSYIKILEGRYEMGVAYSETLKSEQELLACEAAKLILGPGSEYEMSNAYGWHYVRPLETVLSVMVTAPPWSPPALPQFGTNVKHQPLSEETHAQLLQAFQAHYPIT